MEILRVVLLISICALATKAQGSLKQLFNNQQQTIQCLGGHIEIVSVEFKQVTDFKGSKQRNKYASLKEEGKERQLTKNVKTLCHYKQSCNVKEEFGINESVVLEIGYNCVNTGCPHLNFIDKHIMRKPKGMSTEYVAETMQNQRGRRNWVPTDIIDVFEDPEDYMKYTKRGNECIFVSPAPQYRCRNPPFWTCPLIGTGIAIHDTNTGHLIRTRQI